MGKILVAVLAVIIMTSGCASMQELSGEVIQARKAGKEGITKVYPVSPSQAWYITRAVFGWLNTDEIEEHRDENYMITSTGIKMVFFGSVMGDGLNP